MLPSRHEIVAEARRRIRNLGHWSMVQKTQILEEMKNDLKSNKGTTRYELLGGLWTAASAGQVRIANDIFKEMEQRKMIHVGDSSPIDALLKSVCVSSMPSTELVADIWNKMQVHKLRPSQRTADLLLETFSQVADPAAVKSVRQKIIDIGIAPSPSPEPFFNHHDLNTPSGACLYLLKLCVRKRDIKSAEAAISDLTAKHKTKPLVSHFNELMRVYSACRMPGPIEVDERLKLPYVFVGNHDPLGVQGVWSRMLTSGYQPNRWSYDNVLLSLLPHCKRSSKEHLAFVRFAEKVFNEADARNLATEQHLFARLMDIYAASRRDQEAEELLRVMWERNYNIKRSSRVMQSFNEATSGWLDQPARTS
eukprot:TRINITY_DN1562_c0_g1_i2.p1 TRINITY_DN1562_c0_g1~~TRINITY_DN1562_c0_g1_i2.p1  ORF type:complete len:365 (+),score=63.30 TRINITY_DN1562_c0_g1_i2:884-1978(+)